MQALGRERGLRVQPAAVGLASRAKCVRWKGRKHVVAVCNTVSIDKSRSVSAPRDSPEIPDRVPLPRPPLQKTSEVVAMILGGGPGTDLWPLTRTRAEPAVPFAGLFRLIDIPVSNCVNSGITNVYVLAQYNATSLNRHLSRAYSFVNGITFTGHGAGFVETLNATQRPGVVTQDAWFKGTADAVRRYLYLLEDGSKHPDCQDVLILSGDQLYRMDYAQLINYHRQNDADVTIATTPADEDHATHLGILQVDGDLNVQGFCEKPQRKVLATMSIDTTQWASMDGEDMRSKPWVASMGIYVFKKKVLQELLSGELGSQAVDFSRDVLPYVCDQLRIKAYPHRTYWEDVGSLRDYYAANIALAKGTLKLTLWEKDNPIYTEPRTLPPAKVLGSSNPGDADSTLVTQSLVGDGCRIGAGCTVSGCVLGSRTFVSQGCTLKDTIVFGADEYDTMGSRREELVQGHIPLGIGAGSTIQHAIIDSNARIGRNVQLTNARGLKDGRDSNLPAGIVIRDGILVVLRDAVIPDNTVV